MKWRITVVVLLFVLSAFVVTFPHPVKWLAGMPLISFVVGTLFRSLLDRLDGMESYLQYRLSIEWEVGWFCMSCAGVVSLGGMVVGVWWGRVNDLSWLLSCPIGLVNVFAFLTATVIWSLVLEEIDPINTTHLTKHLD